MMFLKIIGATLLLSICIVGVLFLFFCKAMSNANLYMKTVHGDF